jgi:hypothetical protein
MATLGCSFRTLAFVHDLQWELDVLRHGTPVEQGRLLEDDSVVAIPPRLFSALPVDADLAAAGTGEVADEAEQGALAAPGGSDQGHELAALDRQVDPAQGGHGLRSGSEGLPQILSPDHTHRGAQKI